MDMGGGPTHAINQMLHLTAAGAWLGGLLPLGMLLRRAAGPGGAAYEPLARARAAAFLADRLRRGGAGGADRHRQRCDPGGQLPRAGRDRLHGRLLLVKIALFLAMVGLALVNRFPPGCRDCAMRRRRLIAPAARALSLGAGRAGAGAWRSSRSSRCWAPGRRRWPEWRCKKWRCKAGAGDRNRTYTPIERGIAYTFSEDQEPSPRASDPRPGRRQVSGDARLRLTFPFSAAAHLALLVLLFLLPAAIAAAADGHVERDRGRSRAADAACADSDAAATSAAGRLEEPPSPPPPPETPPMVELPPPAPIAETPPPPPPKPEPKPIPKPRPRPQPVQQPAQELPLPAQQLPLPIQPGPQMASIPNPAPAPTISPDYRTVLSSRLETHKRYPRRRASAARKGARCCAFASTATGAC